MFDIGFAELLIIGVVSLLVIGPERLPGTVRMVSVWLGRLRRGFNEIKQEVQQELHNDEVMRELRKAGDEIKQETDALGRDIRKVGDGIRQETDALGSEIRHAGDSMSQETERAKGDIGDNSDAPEPGKPSGDTAGPVASAASRNDPT
jgi:sec-independent protein translocase protein TatB